LLLTALAIWKWPAPRVVVQTQRVEVPVATEKVVTVYQDRIVRVPPATGPRSPKLHPVADLHPRIMRSPDLEN
jgi:hypothetical protein